MRKPMNLTSEHESSVIVHKRQKIKFINEAPSEGPIRIVDPTPSIQEPTPACIQSKHSDGLSPTTHQGNKDKKKEKQLIAQ